jgi:hypothetical protein
MLDADTAHFDEFVRAAIHQFASPSLTFAMELFSFLGSVAFLLGATLLTIVLFIYFHRQLTATNDGRDHGG